MQEASAAADDDVAAAPDSLLARFKTLAATAPADRNDEHSRRRERLQRASQALHAAFRYLNDLVKQLNVVRPPIAKDFSLPGNIVFSSMQWRSGDVDYRTSDNAREERIYESVTLRCRFGSDKVHELERAPLADKTMHRNLSDYNVSFDARELRDENKRVVKTRFRIPSEVRALAVFKPEQDADCIHLRLTNMYRFGVMEFRLPFGDFDQRTLDDLVNLMLGESDAFLRRFRRSA